MKILVVTQYFWPEFFLVNGLVTELQKQGHQVEVLTGLPNYPKGKIFAGYSLLSGPWTEDYSGTTIHRVPLFARRKGFINLVINYLSFVLFGIVFGLFKIRNRPDVIFCYAPSPITGCLPAMALKWKLNRPLCLWVQDLWPESLAAVGVSKSQAVLKFVGIIVRFIYSHCDQILVQSPAFTSSILKWGAKAENIFYIPNWASSLVLKSPEPLWLTELPQGFKIVFAGNIGNAQDMPTVLNAARLVNKKFPDIDDLHWVIVGGGRALDYVKSEIKEHDMEKYVHVIGQKPNEDMGHLFSLADVLLVTLKDEFIFSLTVPAEIQSYMAAGRPILAGLNGAGAVLVAEAAAGLTCPAENPSALAGLAVQFYNMHQDEKDKMGLAGKNFFEKNFQKSDVVKNITVLLEKLL